MLSLGKRIKLIRVNKDMSQEEASKELGTIRANWANWELDRVKPDYNTIKKLAKWGNTTVDYLLGLVDEKDLLLDIKSETKDGRVIEGMQILEELNDDEKDQVLEILRGLKAQSDINKKLGK